MQLMKFIFQSHAKKSVVCLIALAMVLSLCWAVHPQAASAKNDNGTAATTLVLKVGSDGAYAVAKTFSGSDLAAMAQTQQAYTYIDSMPAVCIDSCQGVKLTDVLAGAGIDLGSVQNLTFYSTDGYITNFTKSSLLDTTRYYYPNLPAHWSNGAPTPGAAAGAVAVVPIMAEEDYWLRFATAPNFDAMTGANAFRLDFGQADTSTSDAFNSAKWVYEIDVAVDATSVSLASPAAGQSYWPGENVTISGVAHNLAAVAINVIDPGGHVVYAVNNLDASSGNFTTGFTLGNTAASGSYTIIVSGVGLANAYTSTFNVAAAGSSVSLASPAAGQSYWPGENVTISGAAHNLAAVAINVIDPGGHVVYAVNNLDASSGNFTTGFILGNTAVSGNYTIAVSGAGLANPVTVAFKVVNPGDLVGLTSPTAGQAYQPGDAITIAGTASGLTAVSISVTDPGGNAVYTVNNLDASSGSFTTSFTLDSTATAGLYTVTISAPELGIPYQVKIQVGPAIGPNNGLPDQIILSWTGNPETTQTVSWRTGSDTTQDEMEYLPAAGFTGNFAGAQIITATENDLYPGSYHFEATVQGLTPGTGYVYRVGREAAWSQPASFTTASGGSNFSFLYMGDVQEGYQQWGELLNVASKEKPGPKFALLGGDLVDDSTSDQWQQFFAAATPTFSRIPLMPAAGNHDDGTLFWNSFAVPQNGPDGYKEFYSFDYGNCHIAVLDSNFMGAPGSDSYNKVSAWLLSDLNGSSKTWKFIVLHYPPYQVYPDGHVANLQANWAPIFEQCGVDAVFDGHQQVYARTSPMRDGQIQSDGNGIVYIMGNAGTKYLPVGPDYSYLVKELADVSNYEVVNIDGNTFTMTAKDANGQVIDSYTFTKQAGIIKVTGISLDKAVDTIAAGSSDQLTATITPDDAADKSVTWSSSDATVAKVDQTGRVTAVAVGGPVNVTATTVDGSFTATCTVNVVKPLIPPTGTESFPLLSMPPSYFEQWKIGALIRT
ncbi:MAG: fibronectin type III domain-containing protein [Thermacetogeniaceae bacterium]